MCSIQRPTSTVRPIVISVPHSGLEIPGDVAATMDAKCLQHKDDADFFVDKLYSFAPQLGITVVKAKYHRWVIDLNRTPDSTPLYTDGRVITELVPTRTFLDEPLYESSPTHDDIERRLDQYYRPYYQVLRDEISHLKAHFDNVLLWDAHSIRRLVPTIRKEPFPDLILGSNDETSADEDLIQTALDCLTSGDWDVRHNSPFKGGHITRSHGKPHTGVHALQLEMSKDLYMDNTETKFDSNRAANMQATLIPTLRALADRLEDM